MPTGVSGMGPGSVVTSVPSGGHHHSHSHSHGHGHGHGHGGQQQPQPQRRPKIYCDKWVHEGVCAFTQQGCKYKHEMPFDKVTQHQLGLFHGFPAWWKKHQADLSRQREGPIAGGTEEPARLSSVDRYAGRGGGQGQGPGPSANIAPATSISAVASPSGTVGGGVVGTGANIGDAGGMGPGHSPTSQGLPTWRRGGETQRGSLGTGRGMIQGPRRQIGTFTNLLSSWDLYITVLTNSPTQFPTVLLSDPSHRRLALTLQLCQLVFPPWEILLALSQALRTKPSHRRGLAMEQDRAAGLCSTLTRTLPSSLWTRMLALMATAMVQRKPQLLRLLALAEHA